MKLVVALALLLLPAPAFAQTAEDMRQALERLEGTLSVQLTPMMSDGRVTACTLVFEQLQRDDLYLGGNFIKVSGSLGLMAGDGGKLGFVMKAIANEVDPSTMAMGAMELARVYLVGPSYETNFASMVTSFPADVPGGIFAAFDFDPSTTMLLEAISVGATTIAIGPKSGTSDIQATLDLTVVDTDNTGVRTHSMDAGVGFFGCAESLLSAGDQP